MAKKKKRRKSTPRRATKTARRRSYVTNPGKPPRRRRSYRRNPSPLGNMGELIKLGGGAVAGAIVIPRAVQFVPVDSNVVKNGVGIAAGIALAYFGRRNQLALGAGLGGASVCARNLVTNMAGIGLVLNVVRNRSVLNTDMLTPQTRVRGKYIQ